MNPSADWLKNPEIFNVNRLDAHSDHVWYENNQSYLQDEKTLFQSLDGAWLFQYSHAPSQRPQRFYENDFSLCNFGSIEVPGHIELQGYGQIQYINTAYPWDGRSFMRPPQIDPADNPVGSYVKMFDLAAPLQGKQVCISFQGVEQAFYVWLNGEFVGYSEDSFTPSDFDLTPYMQEKNNRLCVEVYKHSSATWLEDQDFFRFSGIFRSVYLYAKPALHIEDLWLVPSLLEDNKTGTLRARFNITSTAALCPFTVHCKVQSSDEKVLYDAPLVLAEKEGEYVFSQLIVFDSIHAWSNKTPCLYKVILSLYGSDNALYEIIAYDIGFRRFEIKDGIMLLNGARILFNGVNRHEWSAQRGRSITALDMHNDMQVFLRNNINAVRTSHYPNQSLWYDLCDKNGIYMIDEANLESHGSWQKMGAIEPSWNVPANDKRWEACVVDRAKSMFERDKNHTAILIWSCGNESYAGTCIRAMSSFFRKNDPSRLVHYEGVFNNREYNDISDIESRMYATPESARAYLSQSDAKPYILCEYMHNMGNSLGGLESYIRLADEFEKYNGGFIWDFKDQALWHQDACKRRVLGYGGDFGERPTDYAFSANGILFADGTEKPSMQNVRYWYSQPSARAYHDAQNEHKKADAIIQLELQKRYRTEKHAAEALEITEGDTCLGVKGNGFAVLFSYTEGGPSSLISGGTEWIHRAPRPAFWRASTENDKGNAFANKSAVWLSADAFAKCIKYEVTQKTAQSVQISYTYLPLAFSQATATITYTVSKDGVINVCARYKGEKGLPQLPLFGVRFETFNTVDTVKWQGFSGETYPDRLNGSTFGMHSETPSAPNYLVPQEYGCHMQTLAVQLCKQNAVMQTKAELCINYCDKPFAFSALPYTPLELESAQHSEELPCKCRTAISVYGAMRGVGGIDSWGADVEAPYQISAENDIELSFNICL